MIFAGSMTQAAEFERTLRDITVTFRVDTSQFVEQITRTVRTMFRLDFEREVQGLSAHQVDALMYVRGGLDPDFADPDARDNYLRAIVVHPRVGTVAAAAFLTGWCTHRDVGQPDPLAWHRLLGDQPVQVSAP